MSIRWLRLGMSGDDVSNWQDFLRGYGFESHVVKTGTFDEVTFKETKDFQSDNKLNPIDGIVGGDTYAAAKKFGFDPFEDEDTSEFSKNWPSNPGIKPLDYASRVKLFDQFSFVPEPSKLNPEGIRITDSWIKDNIVSVHIPQLMCIKGVSGDSKIFLHKKISQQVIAMFDEFAQKNLIHLIKTFDGAWNPRYIRGSRTSLSNHSWGTAIDINAHWNGLGTPGAFKGDTGSIRELVLIAAQYGMYWGGWFSSRKDPMHFEVYKLV